MLKKPSLNKEDLKNYRPVANVQLASKLLEKCAAKQVINHVQCNNLQEPMQSAYCACHSTETALAKVHNDFQCAIDNQKAVLLLLSDLSAAFDTAVIMTFFLNSLLMTSVSRAVPISGFLHI